MTNLQSLALAASLLAALPHAAQPGAVEPVAAPMRDLKWGQLNFLHTTDTHGWLGGHFQEPQYSADWGDYVSFSEHMRKKADDQGVDLLLVDTGDRIEGNGLYDASTPKGIYQYDIFAEQDVDIMSTGNHELYQPYSVDCEHNTTVLNFKSSYIASNLDYIDPQTGEQVPQAQRYRKFTTKNQGLEIIAFGFIYDFTINANNSVVQPVAETVKEDWFKDTIRQKPDVFVVVGHVGLRMEEFRTIFTTIRKENWHVPILFFGGHRHVRDALSYDTQSFSMASGRYMETIGWMSVDGIKKKTKSNEVSADASLSFSRRYIDNNLYGLRYHSGLDEESFDTEHGKNVSGMITQARKAMNLDEKYGCAPRTLWMSRAKYPAQDNIYSWIQEDVFPGVVTNENRKDKPRLALINTGGIRFDMFKGPVTRDTVYLVSPFTSGFKYVPDVPYKIASKVIGILNSGPNILSQSKQSPDINLLAIPEQMEGSRRPHAAGDDEDHRLELRSARSDSEPELIAGYTTKDDIGDDGDDTVHEAVKHYSMPNCIQAEIAFPEEGKPETVDIVFIDFLQPWIVPSLKLSGGDYSDDDVLDYMEGTFTEKLAEWVEENWSGDC